MSQRRDTRCKHTMETLELCLLWAFRKITLCMPKLQCKNSGDCQREDFTTSSWAEVYTSSNTQKTMTFFLCVFTVSFLNNFYCLLKGKGYNISRSTEAWHNSTNYETRTFDIMFTWFEFRAFKTDQSHHFLSCLFPTLHTLSSFSVPILTGGSSSRRRCDSCSTALLSAPVLGLAGSVWQIYIESPRDIFTTLILTQDEDLKPLGILVIYCLLLIILGRTGNFTALHGWIKADSFASLLEVTLKT